VTFTASARAISQILLSALVERPVGVTESAFGVARVDPFGERVDVGEADLSQGVGL
jgi:hypothetical protein